MKVYFNYAENYIKQLKEMKISDLAFTQKAVTDKRMVLDRYLFNHFPNQRVDYILFDGGGGTLNEDGEKTEMGLCTDVDKLDDLQKTYDYIIIKPPIKDREKFLCDCFAKKKVRFHGTGIHSANIIINYPFDSVDVNPQFSIAKYREIILPDGRRVKADKEYNLVLKKQKMLSLLGFTVNEIWKGNKDVLVKFNIKSFLYMAEKNEELQRGKVNPTILPKQTTTRDREYLKKKHKGATVPSVLKDTQKKRSLKVRETGMMKKEIQQCDYCAIKESCPDFLEHSVCNKSKNFKALAQTFKTRDVGLLVNGLSEILAIQSERYLRGVEFEKASGGFIDKEVTSIENSFFKNVETFLKILKPSLQPQNQYNVLNQSVNVAMSMKELEDGLNRQQKAGLARTIGQVIRKRRDGTTGDSTVVTE